jgi:hypothetical protein
MNPIIVHSKLNFKPYLKKNKNKIKKNPAVSRSTRTKMELPGVSWS